MAPGLDVAAVRSHFPALGRGTTFFDGPAGTQVPRECSAAVTEYLETSNSNSAHGAAFRGTAAAERTSRLIEETHAAAADFFGADDPAECVLGPSMTTLAFAMSRRIAAGLQRGDEVLVSAGDHDANIACWLAAAEDRGLVVKWIEPDLPECTIDPERVARAIGPRTRVVSLGLASNAVGTLVTPAALAAIAERAHAAGAMLWIDAVHAAPHVPLAAAKSGADLMLISTYKMYGPHLGICWAGGGALERLPAHNVRWPGGALPQRLEQGTPAYELFAGLVATFKYLRWLGRTYGAPAATTRRAELRAAVNVIRHHESALTARLLEGLAAIPGAEVHGIADPRRLAERCPTVGFTLAGIEPARVADRCVERGFAVWAGEFACFELMRRMGLSTSGGLVRVGIAHYTSADEVDELCAVLEDCAREARP